MAASLPPAPGSYASCMTGGIFQNPSFVFLSYSVSAFVLLGLLYLFAVVLVFGFLFVIIATMVCVPKQYDYYV